MNASGSQEQPRRDKPPKQGLGPRGFPETYYTSTVLNSTGRYRRYIKKLRAFEEEQRKGLQNTAKIAKDNNLLDFFLQCDRKSRINTVAARVQLCLQSYDENLKAKRSRLKALLSEEEECNVRELATWGQKLNDIIWNRNMERLAFLLAKRKKEFEAKYKDVPIDKCTHVHPCVVSIRNKEIREIQKYQMREKQMHREAEREMDKMWYDLAMKESEALAARMEYDEIQAQRRNMDILNYSQRQIEMKRQQQAKEREMLKQEALMLKADTEAYFREQEEEKRRQKQEALDLGQKKLEMKNERQEFLDKQAKEEKELEDLYNEMVKQAGADENADKERRRQMERDLDECNFKMAELKHHIAALKNNNESLIFEEEQKIRDAADLKRCQYRQWSKELGKKTSEANKQESLNREIQAQENEKEKEIHRKYENQVIEQTNALVNYKEGLNAQARKQYQSDLLKQMEYARLLKEQALQEEKDQRKKYEIATEQYKTEIEKMICRPYFSEEVHPFRKRMDSGIEMINYCPCSSNVYCAAPTKKTIEKQK